MPTLGPTHQRRVACPSASGPPEADGHVLAMWARASRHGHTSVAMPPTPGVAATERSEVDGSAQQPRTPSTSPFGFSGGHPTERSGSVFARIAETGRPIHLSGSVAAIRRMQNTCHAEGGFRMPSVPACGRRGRQVRCGRGLSSMPAPPKGRKGVLIRILRRFSRFSRFSGRYRPLSKATNPVERRPRGPSGSV